MYFDKETSVKRVMGNEKLMRTMLKMFLNTKEINQLEESLTQGDIAQAEVYSHAVKGLSGNLGLTALYESSTQLNNELKLGSCPPETVADYRQVLAGTLQEVQAFLETA